MSAIGTTSFLYVDCDVPEGMTLSAWRTARATRRPAHRRPRLALLRARGISLTRGRRATPAAP